MILHSDKELEWSVCAGRGSQWRGNPSQRKTFIMGSIAHEIKCKAQ
jgi:hypothetical protein